MAVNIHKGLPHPPNTQEVIVVDGDYAYYHYGCNDLDDRGWGCGYRTLQTLCSWTRNQMLAVGENPKEVPTIPAIQKILVDIGDKPDSFIGSKQWIGSVEVAYVIDHVFDVSCRILHSGSGSKLLDHAEALVQHFRQTGSPIMMGGNVDCSSKGIFGVARSQDKYFVLIVDPHHFGETPTSELLLENKMLIWRDLTSFNEDSFYNLCLPLYKQSMTKSYGEICNS